MRKLLAPFKLFAPLKRVGFGLLLSLGVAIAVLFIATSLLVNVQSLAVILTAVGAALGTLIISLALPKMLVSADSQRQKQMKADMEQLIAERAQMAAELERVKSQQLQLQQVQAVMKLTLLEVDTSLTDFKRAALGSREKTLGGQEALEYVGVLRKKAKVMLGMDMARLRVKQVGNELWVDGLHAEYQGMKSDEEEWLFRQVQVHEDNLIMSNKIRVSDDAKLVLPASDQHRSDLDERIKNGTELSAFDASLEKMGEQWLRALFSPLGLSVRRADLSAEQSQLFITYLQERQLQLGEQQQELEQTGKIDMNTAPPLPKP